MGKKAAKGKISAIKFERKEVPVETDPKKLVTLVCGTNLYAEDGKDVELKPDSEYPDWLWTLNTGNIHLSFIFFRKLSLMYIFQSFSYLLTFI